MTANASTPFVVGLTGGIGSGKSTVASLFAELGAGLIDTDALAHELTRPGGRAIEPIRQAFGDQFISLDGSLERVRMRTLVFSDPGAKERLEGILHPLIREETRRRLTGSSAAYVMLVVPLLFETDAYRDIIRRNLVVDCPENIQISRTMQRSNLSEQEVRAIMATQIPRKERLDRADDIIVNDRDLTGLRKQVEILHRQYCAMAKGHG